LDARPTLALHALRLNIYNLPVSTLAHCSLLHFESAQLSLQILAV